MSLPAFKKFQSLAIASWWRSEELMPMVFVSTTFYQRWCETELCFLFPCVVLPKGGSCAIDIKPFFSFSFFSFWLLFYILVLHSGTVGRPWCLESEKIKNNSCVSRSIDFTRSLNLNLSQPQQLWSLTKRININGKSAIWLGGCIEWRNRVRFRSTSIGAHSPALIHLHHWQCILILWELYSTKTSEQSFSHL